VDTDSSDDDNPDQINQTWLRNLKKPQVADFREQIAATFQLNEEKKEIDFFHKDTNITPNASSFRFINIRWVKTLKFAVIV
jgi:hypothetical protein